MDTDVSEPRVVVGVDGSQSSYEALRWAVRYAGLVGGTVETVAVWELPGLYGWSGPAVDMDVDESTPHRASKSQAFSSSLTRAATRPTPNCRLQSRPAVAAGSAAAGRRR